MKQAHICLDETLGVRYAILPGDPARLDRVAAQLESVRELAYNREFRSLTGTYKGVPVLAVSTGIGGSSAGICVEELHNIGVEAAIRIGSCGALQTGIALGDLILGCGAIRDMGLQRPMSIRNIRRSPTISCWDCAWRPRRRSAARIMSASSTATKAFITRKTTRRAPTGRARARWARIWSPQRCLPSAVCAG